MGPPSSAVVFAAYGRGSWRQRHFPAAGYGRGGTYTLVAVDVGKAIKVRVSFMDERNFQETLTSEATATVTAAVTLLTAEFIDTPPSHDGTGDFTFRIAFSEPISILATRPCGTTPWT